MITYVLQPKDKNPWVDYEVFLKTNREYTEIIAEK